jgi:hypothetical protein
MFMLVGCNSTPAEMSPTPDTSIVWSDDFEDENTQGWEEFDGVVGDEYFVENGKLAFGYNGGDIIHPSTVNTGSWSADVFLGDKGGTVIDFAYIATELEPDEIRTSWITIENQPYTLISLNQWDGLSSKKLKEEKLGERERITGWHHIDITRDVNGLVKVYFNNQLMLENNVEFPYESQLIHFYTCCEGQALDNVVVRNRVIEIQPTE